MSINWLGKIVKILIWALFAWVFWYLHEMNAKQFEAGIGLGWSVAMILSETLVWLTEYKYQLKLRKEKEDNDS